MKPRNFPERKNRRRKGALERLYAIWRANDWRATDEIKCLKRLIVKNARNIRTKKHGGKIARQAAFRRST